MTSAIRELTADETNMIGGGTKGGDVGHGKEANLGGGWVVGYGTWEGGGSYAYLVSPKGVLTYLPGS